MTLLNKNEIICSPSGRIDYLYVRCGVDIPHTLLRFVIVDREIDDE